MDKTRFSSELTADEKQAGNRYCIESMIYNAIFQGWSELACLHPTYRELGAELPRDLRALDAAISKSSLVRPLQVWSGHGTGAGIRGALVGSAQSFVGNEYCYPGYISTSAVKEIAVDSFLSKKARRCSRPTLLQFNLPEGFNLLDAHCCGLAGEMEFIIGRGQRFLIADASYDPFPEIDDPVLVLKLAPVLA